MNKRELIKALSATLDVPESDASRFVESFEHIVRDTLAEGGEIMLVGFGKFHCKKQRARIGRHPQTGESIAIPARYLPAFSPGKQLKDAMHPPV